MLQLQRGAEAAGSARALHAPQILRDELHVLLEPLRPHRVVKEVLQEDARAIASDAVVATCKNELGEAVEKREGGEHAAGRKTG